MAAVKGLGDGGSTLNSVWQCLDVLDAQLPNLGTTLSHSWLMLHAYLDTCIDGFTLLAAIFIPFNQRDICAFFAGKFINSSLSIFSLENGSKLSSFSVR